MARNKYPEETKKLIVETAAKLFVEKGYEHTSIQDIINHLGGLSKGAIYHHFKSKDEIMMAVGESLYAAGTKRLYDLAARTDLNGLEKLRRLFEVSAENPAQEEMFSAAPDMLKNPQLLSLYLQDVIQETPALIEKVIREGIADGSIQTDYPRELAEVMILLGNVWVNPMIYHCGKEALERKFAFFGAFLNSMGLDIFSDDVKKHLIQYLSLYEGKEK